MDNAKILRQAADRLRKGIHGTPECALALDAAADEIERFRETLEGIVKADWRTWEELASPHEFVRWAKARAQHALSPNALDQAPQPPETMR